MVCNRRELTSSQLFATHFISLVPFSWTRPKIYPAKFSVAEGGGPFQPAEGPRYSITLPAHLAHPL